MFVLPQNPHCAKTVNFPHTNLISFIIWFFFGIYDMRVSDFMHYKWKYFKIFLTTGEEIFNYSGYHLDMLAICDILVIYRVVLLVKNLLSVMHKHRHPHFINAKKFRLWFSGRNGNRSFRLLWLTCASCCVCLSQGAFAAEDAPVRSCLCNSYNTRHILINI